MDELSFLIEQIDNAIADISSLRNKILFRTVEAGDFGFGFAPDPMIYFRGMSVSVFSLRELTRYEIRNAFYLSERELSERASDLFLLAQGIAERNNEVKLKDLRICERILKDAEVEEFINELVIQALAEGSDPDFPYRDVLAIVRRETAKIVKRFLSINSIMGYILRFPTFSIVGDSILTRKKTLSKPKDYWLIAEELDLDSLRLAIKIMKRLKKEIERIEHEEDYWLS